MARLITVRKTTLAKLDDRFDVEFWASIPPDERLAQTWHISQEVWQFSGRDSGESRLCRSVAVVVRR